MAARPPPVSNVDSSSETPFESLSPRSGSSANVKKEKKKRGRKLTEFNKYAEFLGFKNRFCVDIYL